MILKICLLYNGIFALKNDNQVAIRDFGTFADRRNWSPAGPKFNENCDEHSLEAAHECEA